MPPSSGGGVLILHDTRPHTAEALSGLITELEARGYRFVQLAPAPGALDRAERAPDPLIPVSYGLGPARPAPASKAATLAGDAELRQAQAMVEGWMEGLQGAAQKLAGQIGDLWGG